MPVLDIYSRRKRRAEQTEPEVYQYDSIPDTLRAQIRHIWDDAIGPYYDPAPSYDLSFAPPHNDDAWNFIRDTVCREKGRLSLRNESYPKKDCVAYLHLEEDIDNLLDLVEFSFLYIDRVMGKKERYEREQLGATQDPEDAIKELNFRFR